MVEADNFYQFIGSQIGSRRKKLGTTQEQLAADVGLTRTSITNIEKGRQRVMIHTLVKIADRLKVNDIAEFLPARMNSESINLNELLKEKEQDQRDWIISTLAKHNK